MLLTLQTGHNLIGLLSHLFVNITTLVVVFVDVVSLGQSTCEVLLDQQVNGLHAVLHSSAGIDARTYLENDVAHGELTTCQSANLNDGFQTDARTLIELFQSVEGQCTVLTFNRYDVRCYRDSAEVE